MQYDEIRLTLLQVFSLRENEGRFLTAEQVCGDIKEKFPRIWEEITCSFPENNLNQLYPQLESKYTPVRFIEGALKYYAMNNGIPGLEQGEINITNINDPAKTSKGMTVWRLG